MIEIIKNFVNEDVDYLHYSGEFLIIQYKEPYEPESLDSKYVNEIQNKFGLKEV